MALTYEDALVQIEAKDGQEVRAAFKTWKAGKKSLAEYQVVKNKAATKILKSYRISKGIPLPKKIKEDVKRG